MRKLSHYQPILATLMHFIAKETRFRCRPGLAEILRENPRLIVALSHSTPLSWLPAIALLTNQATVRGGGDRAPMGVVDNFFFQMPLMRELARYLTQSEKPLSYRELSERFANEGDIDLVLFPEGSNCFFGPSHTIQEFRSVKFVDLAIRTNSPILLGVHTGSEKWAKSIGVSESSINYLDFVPRFAADFLKTRLQKSGLFNLPVLPLPMERFEMLCELYQPKLKLSDLSAAPVEKTLQLKREADEIRKRMLTMLDELKKNDGSLQA